MEKIKINSLGVLPAIDKKELIINGITIEVQNKLPYEDMIFMIEWSMGYIVGNRSFISEPLNVIIRNLCIVKFFTNLDLDFIDADATEVSEIYEVYDILENLNVFDAVKELIDAHQLQFYYDTLQKTMESIVTYKNSAIGIIDTLKTNANTTNKDLEEALSYIKDDEKIESMKRLMEMAEVAQPQP